MFKKHLIFVLVALVSLSALVQAEGLRDIAGNVKIGSAISLWNQYPESPGSDSRYIAIARREFNLFTIEGGLFFTIIHPKPREWNFREADDITAFAKANGASVIGPAILYWWGNPKWVENLSRNIDLLEEEFSRTGSGSTKLELDQKRKEFRAIAKRHVQTIVKRYPDITYWVAANEVYRLDGSLAPTIWSNISSNPIGWVELSFRWIHQANPGAKLIYNDNGHEFGGVKTRKVYTLLENFKSRGVPVDAVGFQMHLPQWGVRLQDVNTPRMVENFAKTVRVFQGLGLEAMITELDVRVKIDDGFSEKERRKQAEIYGAVIEVARKSGVRLINLWGFTDKYSWIPGAFPGYGSACIFNESYNRKPAYTAIKGAFIK